MCKENWISFRDCLQKMFVNNWQVSWRIWWIAIRVIFKKKEKDISKPKDEMKRVKKFLESRNLTFSEQKWKTQRFINNVWVKNEKDN